MWLTGVLRRQTKHECPRLILEAIAVSLAFEELMKDMNGCCGVENVDTTDSLSYSQRRSVTHSCV